MHPLTNTVCHQEFQQHVDQCRRLLFSRHLQENEGVR
ncbi:protein of unknown function [Pseudomonas syringae pv. tomato str. DC3000]|uniref:Uncharacterized protein n=1 Tax=Pseudomonas syringae pv. tomato (strain ATCC BAA-871 / DC3000) TaxID=223283 RepID=Q87WH7_PSESM|nr:protein of unknown function [Pseudomonas syringae pv. tomato str. DC3000]